MGLNFFNVFLYRIIIWIFCSVSNIIWYVMWFFLYINVNLLWMGIMDVDIGYEYKCMYMWNWV